MRGHALPQHEATARIERVISAPKKTPFCTRNAPIRWLPPVFLRSTPFFHAEAFPKKSPSGFRNGPVFPKKTAIFAPPRSLAGGDFSGFSVAKRGGSAAHRKFSFSTHYNLMRRSKRNHTHGLHRAVHTTEKSIALATRGQDVTTSACRRSKRSAACPLRVRILGTSAADALRRPRPKTTTPRRPRPRNDVRGNGAATNLTPSDASGAITIQDDVAALDRARDA